MPPLVLVMGRYRLIARMDMKRPIRYPMIEPMTIPYINGKSTNEEMTIPLTVPNTSPSPTTDSRHSLLFTPPLLSTHYIRISQIKRFIAIYYFSYKKRDPVFTDPLQKTIRLSRPPQRVLPLLHDISRQRHRVTLVPHPSISFPSSYDGARSPHGIL